MKISTLIAATVILFPRVGKADATIELSNIDSTKPIFYQNIGTLASGDGFYVELMAQSGAGSAWVPVYIAGNTTSILTLSQPGYFNAGVGIIPGASDNSDVSFYVRAWTGASTYESSIELGQNGQSSIWHQNTGSWDPNSGLSATGPILAMSDSVIISAHPFPEPTTCVLSLFGAIGMCLYTNCINKKRSSIN